MYVTCCEIYLIKSLLKWDETMLTLRWLCGGSDISHTAFKWITVQCGCMERDSDLLLHNPRRAFVCLHHDRGRAEAETTRTDETDGAGEVSTSFKIKLKFKNAAFVLLTRWTRIDSCLQKQTAVSLSPSSGKQASRHNAWTENFNLTIYCNECFLS